MLRTVVAVTITVLVASVSIAVAALPALRLTSCVLQCLPAGESV
jgi:hypothetical protein